MTQGEMWYRIMYTGHLVRRDGLEWIERGGRRAGMREGLELGHDGLQLDHHVLLGHVCVGQRARWGRVLQVYRGYRYAPAIVVILNLVVIFYVAGRRPAVGEGGKRRGSSDGGGRGRAAWIGGVGWGVGEGDGGDVQWRSEVVVVVMLVESRRVRAGHRNPLTAHQPARQSCRLTKTGACGGGRGRRGDAMRCDATRHTKDVELRKCRRGVGGGLKA